MARAVGGVGGVFGGELDFLFLDDHGQVFDGGGEAKGFAGVDDVEVFGVFGELEGEGSGRAAGAVGDAAGHGVGRVVVVAVAAVGVRQAEGGGAADAELEGGVVEAGLVGEAEAHDGDLAVGDGALEDDEVGLFVLAGGAFDGFEVEVLGGEGLSALVGEAGGGAELDGEGAGEGVAVDGFGEGHGDGVEVGLAGGGVVCAGGGGGGGEEGDQAGLSGAGLDGHGGEGLPGFGGAELEGAGAEPGPCAGVGWDRVWRDGRACPRGRPGRGRCRFGRGG